MRYVELSHTLEDGMVTFPGDPPVNIGIYMSREEMRKKCGAAAALLDQIKMINTSGTYLDAPVHRFENGTYICDIPLESLVDLPVEVVPLPEGKSCFEPEDFQELDERVKAVLLYTGFSSRFNTDRYGDNPPYLSVSGAKYLMEKGVAFVGIDGPLIDKMNSGDCPVHDIILGEKGIVCENMTNLDLLLGCHMAVLTAVPPRVKMASFTARVFAKIEE